MNLNNAAKLGIELEEKRIEKRNSELSNLRQEFIDFPENFDIHYRYDCMDGSNQPVYAIVKDRRHVFSIYKNDDLFKQVKYYIFYKTQAEPEQTQAELEQKPNNIPKQTVGSFLRNFF